MGHIGIVPRILDHARAREVVAMVRGRQREGDLRAVRQFDADGIGKSAAQQRRIGGSGGGRGAGARSPASAQMHGLLIAHERINSESPPIRKETLPWRAPA